MTADHRSTLSLHRLGVICGLAAGAWLGAAEAPTKLVTVGFSPFVISLGMVAGVFVARWTVPDGAEGHRLRSGATCAEKPHLIVWAILAGMLWAVANTLTVFAIRNVGLSIAFPLWNTNSLVGLFWGWLLFNELRGAGARQWAQGAGGAVAIVARRVPAGLRHLAPVVAGRRRTARCSAFWRRWARDCCGAPCTFRIARPTSAA